MREPVSVIIPTWNNQEQLHQCVESLLHSSWWYPLNIIIVNNGSSEILTNDIPNVKVIETGENLGWERGLVEGLKHTESKYVCFMNDDTYIPPSSFHWMNNIVRMLEIYPEVGAIGPSSNVVMGPQNIWSQPYNVNFLSPFLIGFCVVVRRSALEQAGGIDISAPGGDDIDLSIRLRQKGYNLLVAKQVFVYHHGFQTGTRVHGDHTKSGGWNSPQMTEKTNEWLIKKHGFLTWWETIVSSSVNVAVAEDSQGGTDTEGDVVRSFIKGKKIVEIGVGAQKTVPQVIGVDRIPKGQPIPFLDGALSVADVIADADDALPMEDASTDTIIARHVLEHLVNSVKSLKDWHRVLKKGGRLIISVPDERITETIGLNPEHVHAFTPESLGLLGEAVGFTIVEHKEYYNGVSFTIVFEK